MKSFEVFWLERSADFVVVETLKLEGMNVQYNKQHTSSALLNSALPDLLPWEFDRSCSSNVHHLKYGFMQLNALKVVGKP